ncbi:uncharacterized protein ACNS7B_021611 isoform 1-T1 [Menidia menidia]
MDARLKRVTIMDIFVVFCLAILTFSHCKADHRLPAPTGLSPWWIDDFNLHVNWSWTRPDNLPHNCTIEYAVYRWTKTEKIKEMISKTTDFEGRYLTNEMLSGNLHFEITALGCKDWSKSEPANISISTSHVELVKDFKCFVMLDKINCSWLPVDPSQKLSLIYRYCGKDEKEEKTCPLDTRQNFCVLEINWHSKVICVLVKSGDRVQTLKPKLMIKKPVWEFQEVGDYLTLRPVAREIGTNCTLEIHVSYNKCGESKQQLITSDTVNIPYDECCEYKIQYYVATNHYCLPITSNNSDIQVYGTNRSCFKPVTVVAIVIPIILFLSVMMSCYCFRRYRHIFCPVIPDPSDFLKGMMNGNKEVKTATVNLYEPVPEPLESEKVILVPEERGPPI